MVEWLARHEGAVALAERLGAHALVDQVDRLRYDGDVVALSLPLRAGDLRSKRIRMFRRGGQDQVAQALWWHGLRGFEHPLPTLFRAVVDGSKGLVLDVGANTGLYSLIAAATGREVHAFEPYAPVVALLRANLELNGLADAVTVLEAAVTDHDGSAKLYVPDVTHARAGELVETSASLDAAFKDNVGAEVDVEVTSLDSYWHRLGEPPVAVVKIDVEGHEAAVLHGALDLLERCRPVVFVEVLGTAEPINAIKERLEYVDVRLRDVEAIFGDVVRFDRDAWNHALIPVDWISAFAGMATAAALTITDVTRPTRN